MLKQNHAQIVSVKDENILERISTLTKILFCRLIFVPVCRV